MAHVQTMSPAPVPRRTGAAAAAEAEPTRFLLGGESLAKPRSVTLTVSALVHGLLVLLVVAIPLFLAETMPEPSNAIRAFFVTPPDVAPPPPPPPPPAPAAHSRATPPSAAPVVRETKFTAPVEIPVAPPPEEGLAFGLEGGVPGGVEGGVPGGVVGGIVGGLPSEAPAVEEKKVVRVGGNIHPPALIERVTPAYPDVAIQARLKAIVILEARVGEDGRVKSVKILRGQILFDQAAMDAVKQWRYRPLLLNGEPTEFEVTITVSFNLHQTTAS